MKQPKLTNEQIALELLSGKVWCQWCYATGVYIYSDDGKKEKCACCYGTLFITPEKAIGWTRGFYDHYIKIYREHGYEPQNTQSI